MYRDMSAPLLPSAAFAASRGGWPLLGFMPIAAIQRRVAGSLLSAMFAGSREIFESSRASYERNTASRASFERDGRTRFSGTLETCRDKTSSPGQVAQKVAENRTPDVSAPLSTEGRFPKLTLKNPAQKRAWMLALPASRYVLPGVPPPDFSGLAPSFRVASPGWG